MRIIALSRGGGIVVLLRGRKHVWGQVVGIAAAARAGAATRAVAETRPRIIYLWRIVLWGIRPRGRHWAACDGRDARELVCAVSRGCWRVNGDGRTGHRRGN